ncbi:T9SS type A sorting domain-containing protein [Hymenobacter ruricola]|uniref:Glycosyl hydrolase n=1 Tax=Hymenobacter ruricola TaxID=2791023 RepID=A0ABS0IA47_9BACT|nr:T9SS type A sorting domain-containing protein [Hymenobacter ruricola]MBF9223831.1 glycosyl hydrolase [Hymenobacter ruricola]
MQAARCGRLLPLLVLLAGAARAQSPHPNVLISAVNNPNETAIMLNPKNPQEVVAGANLNNAYFSTNGGQTWTRQQLTSPQTVYGDPGVACDTTGAFYFLHLTNPGTGGLSYPFIDRMQVQRAASVAGSFSLRGSFGLNPPKQQDKGWLAVDRRTNALYCTWTEFDTYASLNARDSTRILFSRSLDGAQTWSAPVRISRRGGDARDESNTVEGAVPAAGPNGEVYVSWAGPRGIEFNRSLDGGLTWPQGERLVSPQPGGWAYGVPGLDRSNGLPVTACDLSRGPRRGTLYVNWTDQRNGPSDTDVWLASSADGGLTWTAPRRVNNDPAGTHQFLTWMAVDQVTGYLWFVFYDRRNYPAGSEQTDVYGARSTDGGLTFQNFRLSQTPFTPDDLGFLGDYNNITAHNNVVRPCWTRMEANLTTSVWTALLDPTLLASTAASPVGLRLEAYPSPARELLNVAWELPGATECRLTLRDALGRVVNGTARRFMAGAQQVALPVSGLAPGVYTLEAQLGSQRLFRRVLVQH